MAYIGNTPAEAFSAFQKQDFTTSATTSYTLDHPVANQNEIALFINFVRQEPTAAYTASGTTLTLTSATSSSDDMYCVYLGKAVQTVNPPSGSVGASQLASDAVTAAKLNDDIISGQTALASEPADTDEFLVSDAGTLKRIDYSLIKGGGITEADQFRLTADLVATNGDITSNLERVDDASFEKIGTGMTNSSGIFSFPSTGLYQIITTANAYTSSQDNVYILTKVTINNSDYDDVAHVGLSVSNSYENTATMSNLVNVTNTSNVKVKFTTDSFASGSGLQGDTNYNQTSFTFIRLGDSQ
jgi:hypothetical protein